MRKCGKWSVLLAALLLLLCAFPALAYTVPNDTVVYVTDNGTKYHREGCTYLKSSRAMTIAQAEARGYEPCSRCGPDKLTGSYESSWSGTIVMGSTAPGSGNTVKAAQSSGGHEDGTGTAVVAKENKKSVDVAFWILMLLLVLFSDSWTGKGRRRRDREGRRGAAPGGNRLTRAPKLNVRPSLPAIRDFEKEKEKYTALYGGKAPEELVHIPAGVEIGASGLPKVTGAPDWGGRFTVYISDKGKCYHKKQGCGGARTPAHICVAAYRRSACPKCCKSLPDLSWYREYLRIKGIKERYGIQ